MVSPNWLTKIAQLLQGQGQHWSEINVEDYLPRTIELFNNMNGIKRNHSPHSHSMGSSASLSSRRDAAASLSASISETYQKLIEENPDVLEEEALKRALDLSMLDFAIVHHAPGHIKKSKQKESPHETLQVEEDASPSEIKNAYRRRALETHPDKGNSMQLLLLIVTTTPSCICENLFYICNCYC